MTDQNLPILLSALLLGFVGSGHCLGMCGGIAGALGQVTAPIARSSPLLASLLYSAGRITSYGVLGALAGGFGASMNSLVGLGPAVRVIAGVLIVVLGLHTAGWEIRIAQLERAGLSVWRRLSPLVGRVGQPDRIWKLVVLGALWGWLPCGLVYTALAAAAATGDGMTGSAFMVAFGLGTMPALILATGAAGQLGAILRRRAARHAVGAILVLFGLWTMVPGLSTSHGANHSAAMAPPHEVGEHALPERPLLTESDEDRSHAVHRSKD